MSQSSSTPSGCRQRRRCVGTDRRRSALSPRPRRYWPCCPPGVFAVLPSMNPPQLNPMPSVANAPRAAPCRSCFNDSPWYQTDVGTRLSSQLGEEGFLPPNMARQIMSRTLSSLCSANNSPSHPCRLGKSGHPFRVSASSWDASSTSETYAPGTLPLRRSVRIESETTHAGIDWAPLG
jgi:hypothetical protein